MKKSLLLIISAFLLSPHLFSQRFVGINTGNYPGITGVMLQPASIVDSRFKFDINLFSSDVRYSNNYFLLNREVLLKFNKNRFGNYETFRSKYLAEAQLQAGEKAFFNISNRTQLPLSFMVTLGEKSALALNLQSRTMFQGRNISQDVAKLAFNNFYYQPFNNQSLDASGLTLRSLSWAEVGLTYGRVLLNSGNHFLKGAVTGKYLAGVSSSNLASNNLTVQVNSDSTFNFNTDRVTYNHNEDADFDRVFDTRFRPDANALGADVGLVYEYRGHPNNFKYIRNDDETSYEVDRRDLNKYIFRLGVSLLDVGMFTFSKTDNANSFQADINNWNIRNSHYSSLREFDTALAKRVTALPNDPREYNVYLPGALSVQMDVRFVKGLFLNALAYRPLKLGSEAGTRFDNYGYYSITPRFETRHFGIYIPYTFSDRRDIADFRDNQLGLALRLGPVFLGSSNLGSMAFNQKLKAADFFVGFKVGFTYGKPSRINRLFSSKKQSSGNDIVTQTENSDSNRVRMAQTKTRTRVDNRTGGEDRDGATRRMIVDYSKGQIYTDGKTGQVIVINNNYYGNAPKNGTDSIYNGGTNLQYAQQNQNSIDSVMRINQEQKRRADSANNVLRDSLSQKREQLDTLINNLNNLRDKLDSTNKADTSVGYNNQLNRVIIPNDDTTARMNSKGDSTAKMTSRGDTTVKTNSKVNTRAKMNSEGNNASNMSISGDTAGRVDSKGDTTAKMSVRGDTTAKIDSRGGTTPAKINTSGDVNIYLNDSLSNNTSQNDSLRLNTAARGKKEPVKKKVTTAVASANQPDTTTSNRSVPRPADNGAVISANNRVIRQQQQVRDAAYEDYINQSKRLQADIERLERQIAYNRSVAYRPVPMPSYQPSYYSTPRRSPVSYPVNARSGQQSPRDSIIVRDTVRIRDTVFLAQNAAGTKNALMPPKTVFVPVTKTEVVKEEIDYKNLPAENILFGIGHATIRQVYFQKLNYLANILHNNPQLRLSISGHTDKTGSPLANELLSFKRANSVKNFFVRKGINQSRMQLTAVAAEDPLVEGNTKSAKTQNRRVEIQIIE